MPKGKSSKTKKSASKKSTAKSAKKVKAEKEVVVQEVAAQEVAAQEVAAQEVAAPSPPSLEESFKELLGQLSTLRSQLTAVTGKVRALQKRSDRELKNALKAGKKRARKTGNRKPSGFVKPTKISSELAKFLGKPKGSEMARTQVTREINKYIRAHDLQSPENGRIILADSKLRKLLKLKQDDELTYFNLQRYMSPHFAKKGKAAPQ